MGISLVILAAGIGSRYGAGIKQLETVGPSGELIIDYSVHDAACAGFDKVVFIVRREILDDFKKAIGDRIEGELAKKNVSCEYVFQEMGQAPKGRTKPWGTGQALCAVKGAVDGPFAVINADDYYGKSAFKMAIDFLSDSGADNPARLGMIAYILKNTLSESGGVTRGICRVSESGDLIGIDETKNIIKTPEGAKIEGGAALDPQALVSMNFWLFPKAFLDGIDKGFEDFKANLKDPLKDEYLLPGIVDGMLKRNECSVHIIKSSDSWFGMTYAADKASVKEEFKKLHENNIYGSPLWA